MTMQVPPQLYCSCCGLLIPMRQTTYCPRCSYPLSASHEERFLASSLLALQQVADDGVAAFSLASVLKLHQDVGNVLSFLPRAARYAGNESLTVKELIQRYEQRLEHIRLKKTLSAEAAAPEIRGLKERVMYKPLLGGEPTVRMEEEHPGRQVMLPLQHQTTRSTYARPALARPTVLKPSRLQSTPVPRPPHPARVAALKSFFVDSPISLMVFLGAFLILMATLTFVLNPTDPTHHPDPLLALLVVLCTQIFFGAAGIGTQRLSKFINVARIYAFVFVLLIPVLGIEGYLLLERQTLHIGLPITIVIAGMDAAIAYGAFAVYQRFSPFGYLGMAALVTADLATVTALHLGIEWYPCALLMLALPALVSIRSSVGPPVSPFAVLRNPLRICMFLLVASAVILFPLFFYVFPFIHAFGLEPAALRLAKLSTLLLLLLWGCLFLWLTKLSRRAVPTVPYVFIVGVLVLAHTLDFSSLGYALLLTGIALLYHAFSRFTPRLLEPFGKLALRLDQVALLLVSVIPFLIAPQVPSILLYRTALSGGTPFFSSPLSAWVSIAALAIGVLLTISVILHRIHTIKANISHGWPWLLLLSGVLLTWLYAVVALPLFSDATWAFLALTLALASVAVLVRKRLGAAWANPLDVLALAETLLTLNVWRLYHPALENGGGLLLLFATLSYLMLLYQRRPRLLVLPFLFAIASLVFLPRELWLLLGLCLPVASAVIARLNTRYDASSFALRLRERPIRLMRGPEWPLQMIGVICGILVIFQDVTIHTSTLQSWPVAAEISLFCLSWYFTAVLTRRKDVLVLATGFAVAALWFSSLPFEILIGVATITAVLGLVVSRLFARSWALPFYTSALLAAVLTGGNGMLSNSVELLHLSIPYVLLGFAGIVYAVLLYERQPGWLFLAGGFAIWGIVLLPQTVLVICVGLGSGLAGLLPGQIYKRATASSVYTQSLYILALVAAVLTAIHSFYAPFSLVTEYGLLAFTGLAILIMLIERLPVLLVAPAGLAAWTIWTTHWDIPLQLIVSVFLCVLLFAAQFIWGKTQQSQAWLTALVLPRVLGLGGLALLLLVTMRLGNTGMFGHIGAGTLTVLALLITWSGHAQPKAHLRHACNYVVGLLFALVISWELLAFGQTKLDILLLAPASYLSVIAPFLIRDKEMVQAERIGHFVAILGAALLLLPTGVLSLISNNQDNLLSTLLLLGEALSLFFLGILTRMRFFMLGGAGLLIAGALRALFLPSSPLLIWTLMAVSGGALLLGATLYILLVRGREESMSEAK